MLQEVGMQGEVVVFAVFEAKDTLRLQQLLLEDELRNLRQLLQGIGRIGKDEVDQLMTRLQK